MLETNYNPKSALIAMSGGVDSSVAALLMKRAGYTCTGATMRLYRDPLTASDNSKSCCSDADEDDAAYVCWQLGIPFESLCCTKQFERDVIGNFISEYEAGRTPNPCIVCNRCLKFGALMDFAKELGCDCLATGHYARITKDENSGRLLLRKALDPDKDQSYVLYMLSQEQLAFLRFPLGDLRKSETRALADEAGFVTAAKRESQDICFVPDGDYTAFIERYTGSSHPDGAFVDEDGNVVGTHRGSVRYTIGQRKGLGISLGSPAYVIDKDMEKNTVTVGPNSSLYAGALIAGDMNWISIPELSEPMRVKAKIRYRQAEQWAVVSPCGGGRVRVDFDTPQRAITTGQAVVLYDGDAVVGGGTICQVCRGG